MNDDDYTISPKFNKSMLNADKIMCTTSIQMQEIVTVTEAVIESEEHTINGKNGDFMLKSKMNENFRKASAFWKAT